MNKYDECLKVMEELFARDSFFALATAKDNIPSVRYIDTYYKDGAFYIVTHESLGKVQELTSNPNVALCHFGSRFNGVAKNIGHPLDERNKEIREILIKEFEPWYFPHNNEEDKGMCYVKVDLTEGSFQKGEHDETIYKIDFKNKTGEIIPPAH